MLHLRRLLAHRSHSSLNDRPISSRSGPPTHHQRDQCKHRLSDRRIRPLSDLPNHNRNNLFRLPLERLRILSAAVLGLRHQLSPICW